jgi:hypothetical protein
MLLAALGLPLVVAALLAAGTYAWNSFTASAAPVQATGAALQDRKGVATHTLKIGDVEYLVVSSYGKNFNLREEDKFYNVDCHYLTFYELNRKGDNDFTLRLVGSRCVEWDKGADLIGFNAQKGGAPSDLRKLHR